MTHHHGEYDIPDWRIFKVENVEELVNTRQRLARHGLKDPWLRNEVWRYDKKLYMKGRNLGFYFIPQLYVGVVLLFVVVGLRQMFYKYLTPEIKWYDLKPDKEMEHFYSPPHPWFEEWWKERQHKNELKNKKERGH